MSELTRAHPVVVVGGGVAGTAVALALHRTGHRVLVLERREAPEDGGAGLHLWGNGTWALDRLGVLGTVMVRAPRQRVCSFLDDRGRALGAWPVAHLEEELGCPTIAVERRDLVDALRAALPDEVIRVGASARAIEQDDEGVRVFLEDGTSVEGVLAVAADGVHSRIRQSLPGARPVRRHGYVTWRARVRSQFVQPGTFEAYFGPGQRFTYYDVAPGVVHWMAVVESAEDVESGEGALEELRGRFATWPWAVRELLIQEPLDGLLRHEVVDRDPERAWGIGRVTVAGDAAHPITFNLGQGASQALEDALELAACLEHVDPGDPQEALRRYERARRRRTAPLQRLARGIGRLGRLSGSVGVRVRRLVMGAAWDRAAYGGTRRDVQYAVNRFQQEAKAW